MASDDPTSAPPSAEPGDDDGSMAGMLRTIMRKVLQDVDNCLPCRVVAVEGRQWASVQPMVMMGTTDGRKVSRAAVSRVPIFTMGAGNFVLSFPVKAGDFGWLHASDRDISLFLQGLAEEWPNTTRLHSFEDGVFYPDIMREWTLDGGDAERMVLQSLDGASRIAIGTDRIRVVAPVVEIVSATVTMSGNLTVAGHVTGNGIVLDTHTHSGVTVGGGVTGPPSP